MNKNELEIIKQKALEAHIPIIMDDTLEIIEKELKENAKHQMEYVNSLKQNTMNSRA